MTTYRAQVRVWLKPSVFDPQGNAVEKTLLTLGFAGIEEVRIGKSMEFLVTADNQESAEAMVDRACRDVLCNPVMEMYTFTLEARQEA